MTSEDPGQSCVRDSAARGRWTSREAAGGKRTIERSTRGAVTEQGQSLRTLRGLVARERTHFSGRGRACVADLATRSFYSGLDAAKDALTKQERQSTIDTPCPSPQPIRVVASALLTAPSRTTSPSILSPPPLRLRHRRISFVLGRRGISTTLTYLFDFSSLLIDQTRRKDTQLSPTQPLPRNSPPQLATCRATVSRRTARSSPEAQPEVLDHLLF